MAEVLVAGAGGHDQRVVGHFAAVTQLDAVAGDIDADHFTEQHPRVVLSAKDRPQRRGDIGRRQPARGHLIEQRLKKMEISPVDQCDMHRRMP